MSKFDNPDYFDIISQVANGYHVLANAYHNLHESGFADWKGTFLMPDVGQNEIVQTITDQIYDDMLAKAFNSLRMDFDELKNLDKHIVEWLARYVGLCSVQERKDIVRLERKLHKIITNGPDGSPQGPIWALHPEYCAFVEQSKYLLDVITKDQHSVNQRIQQLSTKSAGNDR
jgi:hypothetical protein